MDVSTGLTILGGAIGSAKLVEKILGPTSEYLGDGLKNWTEQRVKNLGKIFEKAEKKLGKKIENEGAVPPKVLKGILSEGSFCDDELFAEYFGGVLASSRTTILRDDRGAAFVGLVSRLTTYQVRSHFICYQVFKSMFNGRENTFLTQGQVRMALGVWIPFESFRAAMDFGEGEDFFQILPHIMFGLGRENLVEAFEYGETPKSAICGGDGIVFHPSVLGVELFLWANGRGDVFVNQFLDAGTIMLNDTGIVIPSDAKSVAGEEEKKLAREKAAKEMDKHLNPEF